MAKKPSTAVATPVVALPTDYNQQAEINAFKSRLAAAESNKIQVTQDKHFKVPIANDDPVKVQTIRGIIVEFISRRNKYEGAFDRDNISPPQCFAIGFTTHNNLIPSVNSPEAQSESCKNCENSQWEKDAKGNWIVPDCKTSYRLAIVAPDDNGSGRLMTLDISSTGITEFDKYIRKLAGVQKAPFNVVTEFSFDPKKDFPSVRCKEVADVPESGVGFVISLRSDAVSMITREPNLEVTEKAAPKKKLPAPKRKAA